ncbi:hypothetical protein D3C80_1848400 [compost metagenome]
MALAAQTFIVNKDERLVAVKQGIKIGKRGLIRGMNRHGIKLHPDDGKLPGINKHDEAPVGKNGRRSMHCPQRPSPYLTRWQGVIAQNRQTVVQSGHTAASRRERGL